MNHRKQTSFNLTQQHEFSYILCNLIGVDRNINITLLNHSPFNKMTEFEDPRVEELDSDDEVVESKVAVPDEDEVQ